MKAIDRVASTNNVSLKQLWTVMHTNRAFRQPLLDMVLITESRFFQYLSSIQFVTELRQKEFILQPYQKFIQPVLSHNEETSVSYLLAPTDLPWRVDSSLYQ